MNREKNLVESAMKKLTRAEFREVIEFGMMLGADDGLGLSLLKELAK